MSRTSVLNLERSSGAQTAANLEPNTLSSRTNSIRASPQLNGLVSVVTLIWRQGLEDEKNQGRSKLLTYLCKRDTFRRMIRREELYQFNEA